LCDLSNSVIAKVFTVCKMKTAILTILKLCLFGMRNKALEITLYVIVWSCFSSIPVCIVCAAFLASQLCLDDMTD